MKRRDVAAGWLEQYAVIEATAGKLEWRDGTDTIAVSCHEGTVPAFIEADIARLYGGLYSSIPLLRLYGSLDQPASTVVMQKNGQLDGIFLLGHDNESVVSVLNEGMPVDGGQLCNLARFVFKRYPGVSVIRLPSIEWRGDRNAGFPVQRYRFSENIALELPADREVYHKSLGKNTRRNLKRYGERLLRDFPDFSWTTYQGDAAPEEDVREIIRLNVLRMASKNKRSTYDDEETERLVQLARQCGLVGVARIGGRVAAGGLAFRTGDNVALSVLSHHPRWNDYSLGILCAYNMICDSIAVQAREFQFLWGRYDYKFQLLARERPLERVILYRSGLQALLHADVLLRTQVEAWRAAAADYVHELGKHETPGARAGMKLLATARSLRRWLSGSGPSSPG